MPNYQNSKIYKLWSPQGTEDEIYIGSTTDELHKRKNSHKKKGNNCNSKILFQKYDDIRIEVLEEYPCNSKKELEKKEGEHIRANKCLNTHIPSRTRKEYNEDNKEHIKEKCKEYRENNKKRIKKWREDNKDKIVEKKKEYYEKNKDKIAEKQKEWREDNKEQILEKTKQYRENNKDKIKEYLEKNKEAIAEYKKEYNKKYKEKVTCECGCIIRKDSLIKHKKSNKHLGLMKD